MEDNGLSNVMDLIKRQRWEKLFKRRELVHVDAVKEFYARMTLTHLKKKDVVKTSVRGVAIEFDHLKMPSILGIPGNNEICEYIKDVWKNQTPAQEVHEEEVHNDFDWEAVIDEAADQGESGPGETCPAKRSRKAKSLAAFKAVVEEEEEKEEVRVATGISSPTVEELEKEEHKEEGPSDQTLVSDGGVRREQTEDVIPQASVLEEDEEEDDVGQREGKGSIMEEEEEEEEEEEDSCDVVGKRPPTRKLHLGVLSIRRLRMPSKKMMKRYADTLLASSSLGTRMALDTLPRQHELALMMRNNVENDRLKGELMSEKNRLIELATASIQLKADVVKVTKEN
ncbi:hypothetical protein Dimus_007697 [Dionaea muscipula]